MISKYKKYYTKLGYSVSVNEYGKEYCSGIISGDDSYSLFLWNTDSQKCFRKYDENGSIIDLEDEDYDLVETCESFQEVKKVKEPEGVFTVKDGGTIKYSEYDMPAYKSYKEVDYSKIKYDVNWDDYVTKITSTGVNQYINSYMSKNPLQAANGSLADNEGGANND